MHAGWRRILADPVSTRIMSDNLLSLRATSVAKADTADSRGYELVLLIGWAVWGIVMPWMGRGHQYLSMALDPHSGHLLMNETYSVHLVLFHLCPHFKHFKVTAPLLCSAIVLPGLKYYFTIKYFQFVQELSIQNCANNHPIKWPFIISIVFRSRGRNLVCPRISILFRNMDRFWSDLRCLIDEQCYL